MCLASLPVFAEANLEELVHVLDDLSQVLGNLIENGFTIEHFEFDSLVVDNTYPIRYPFYEGFEYVVVGIGGPAITDFDIYLFDEEGEPIIDDTEVGRFASVTLNIETSQINNIVFHNYSIAEEYSESTPYYFAFVIAAR